MADAHPVLFIGLDGAESRLVKAWMADGTLPVLAGLAAKGSCRDVATLPAMGDGALWPSLITGVNPARHGRYFRIQLEPRSYRRRAFEVDRDLTYAPFWSPLSEAGDRVAVLDVPYAPLAEELNGTLLVDWLIHDRYGRTRGWPQGFADQVLERFGDDPLGGESDRLPKDLATVSWTLARCLDRVRMKRDLVIETMAKERWDLVTTVFTEPHDVGHLMWHLHDECHPRYDPEWRHRNGDPLRVLYGEIDAAIGRMVDAAEPGTTVMIFMGLGMGPDYTANRLLDRVLFRLDGMADAQPANLRRRLQRRHAPQILLKLARRLESLRRVRLERKSRFFAMPHNENSGAIRINLKGRESSGVVAPEAFDSVCSELSEALLELVNPVNGEPIVSEVVRVSEHYRGERLEVLPDLMVIWNRNHPFEAVSSQRIGTLEGARSWGRSGDHTPNAMLIASGGSTGCIDLAPEVSVLDIAPTIAALRGRSLPGLDGCSAWLSAPAKEEP